MFFKKKNKISIWSNLIPMEIMQNYFKLFPNNLPNYFKNIPNKIAAARAAHQTMKSCSGFLNYFLRSMVFYSPCDIEINYNHEGAYANFGGKELNDGRRFTVHNDVQFLKYVNQEEYIAICKINLDIHINSEYPILINDCWWHFNSFKILPGVINTSKYPQNLNLFIALPKNKNSIFIPQNKPLCHIFTESEKDIKIDFKKDKYDSLRHNNYNYLFDTLSRTILKRKYKIW